VRSQDLREVDALVGPRVRLMAEVLISLIRISQETGDPLTVRPVSRSIDFWGKPGKELRVYTVDRIVQKYCSVGSRMSAKPSSPYEWCL